MTPSWEDLIELVQCLDPGGAWNGGRATTFRTQFTLEQSVALQWVRDHPTKTHRAGAAPDGVDVEKILAVARELEAPQLRLGRQSARRLAARLRDGVI